MKYDGWQGRPLTLIEEHRGRTWLAKALAAALVAGILWHMVTTRELRTAERDLACMKEKYEGTRTPPNISCGP